jgi:deazaflavin-dependent oxidoreductase (nitroreductase family)
LDPSRRPEGDPAAIGEVVDPDAPAPAPTLALALVRAELADSPIVDITTTGRRSGQPRRIEIWMLDVDGRFFITGTPGPRAWLANLAAAPSLVVHLKRHARRDLPARAAVITDPEVRRYVLTHPSAAWYLGRATIEELIAGAPMVELRF